MAFLQGLSLKKDPYPLSQKRLLLANTRTFWMKTEKYAQVQRQAFGLITSILSQILIKADEF